MARFEGLFLEYLRSLGSGDCAHDVDHVLRVVRTAKELCAQEGALLEVVVPAAYLHDCFSYPKDHPDRGRSSRIAADTAIEFLREVEYPETYYEQIHHAICSHSYSSGLTPETKEAQIVQDADRLDAIGAIGIARCIQVGTLYDRPLYSSHDPFCAQRVPDDLLFTIDHFYVKLLKIADSMGTRAAQKEASRRKEFMLNFLKRLEREI